MNWFKHLVTSTSDPDIMESEVKFKTAGPYVFWRVLEILAREDALDKPLVMDFKAFKMWFPSVSCNKLKEILRYFSSKKRINGSIVENIITIHCCKLSDISSNYTKKIRREYDQ